MQKMKCHPCTCHACLKMWSQNSNSASRNNLTRMQIALFACEWDHNNSIIVSRCNMIGTGTKFHTRQRTTSLREVLIGPIERAVIRIVVARILYFVESWNQSRRGKAQTFLPGLIWTAGPRLPALAPERCMYKSFLEYWHGKLNPLSI